MNDISAQLNDTSRKLLFKEPPLRHPLNELVIRSARTELRPITSSYADEVFKEFTEEIAYYMVPSAPERIEECHYFIESCQAGLEDQTDIVTMVLDNKTGAFLGCVGLNVRDNPRTPELGIWMKKSAHGKGLGREAMTALHGWAVQHIDFDYFIYPVDRANLPSRKVAESLNGEIFEEAKKQTNHGRILDEVIYKIPNRKPVRKGGAFSTIKRILKRAI